MVHFEMVHFEIVQLIVSGAPASVTYTRLVCIFRVCNTCVCIIWSLWTCAFCSQVVDASLLVLNPGGVLKIQVKGGWESCNIIRLVACLL